MQVREVFEARSKKEVGFIQSLSSPFPIKRSLMTDQFRLLSSPSPFKSHQNPHYLFPSFTNTSSSLPSHLHNKQEESLKYKKGRKEGKMAQREKEETEFKVPETLILCVNNCGYSGNPATQNMCQKCFQAAGFRSPPPCAALEKPKPASSIRPIEEEKPADVIQILTCETADPPVRQVNRCSCCRKKVGLTGFRCRCGDLFCSEHRYSDRHACGYDYKSAGREAIARENPVVRAAKIVRI